MEQTKYRLPQRKAADLYTLPRLTLPVSCGFPSPADDHLEPPLDLFTHLVSSPNTTYFMMASGDSMRDVIQPGDLLIVDRSKSVRTGSVVIVSLHGELTCKLIDLEARKLRAYNREYPDIEIGDNDLGLICEGVVTHAISALPGFEFP